MTVLCPYCRKPCQLVTAWAIYRDRHRSGRYWQCEPCQAHVGCHKGTENPLGSPAKVGLRGLRREVHMQFDPLWKRGTMTRKQAYKWLAEAMGLEVDQCHIGYFEENECYKAMRLIREAWHKKPWKKMEVRS